MLNRSTSAREFSRRLPNAAILAILVALGIWGHRHHWRMPRFSEFVGTATAPHSAATAATTIGENDASESSGGDSSGPSGSNGLRGAAQGEAVSPTSEAGDRDDNPSLPVIRFRSLEAVQKAGIRVETAEVQELDEFVVANGVVEYDETHLAQLAARVPGIAWRVDKKVGDSVRKGEVLAILDSSDVGKAKAELLEAAVNFDLKTETLHRLENIRSSVPGRSIREAEAEEKVARVRRINAQQTLINLGLSLPSDWDRDLGVEQRAEKIQFLGIPGAIVAGFGPDIVTANLIPLTAPFDGVVIDREIVTGEVAQTGHPQFVIADVSRVWLKLNVRKADAGRLAIGQDIWFSSDGVPGEVISRLSWIATEVDEKTRTVQVRAEAENPWIESAPGEHDGQRLLRAHTFGTARIRVRDERRTVVVPGSAIQSDGGRFLVFVPSADGRSFEPRAVVLGITRDHHTEVVRGLKAGEEIVTSGTYVLKAEFGREQAAASVSIPR
jgi:cobalt-zinc-cadmium efflux system membrane fusion protein